MTDEKILYRVINQEVKKPISNYQLISITGGQVTIHFRLFLKIVEGGEAGGGGPSFYRLDHTAPSLQKPSNPLVDFLENVRPDVFSKKWATHRRSCTFLVQNKLFVGAAILIIVKMVLSIFFRSSSKKCELF